MFLSAFAIKETIVKWLNIYKAEQPIENVFAHSHFHRTYQQVQEITCETKIMQALLW